MDKKQIGIIVVLLVLIVCAGVLATKLNNNPSYVNGDDGTGNNTVSSTDSNQKSATASVFSDVKLTRDHDTNQLLQQLQALIDDKNQSTQSKDNASSKYTAIVTQSQNSSKIEGLLKMKGFEDSVCTIEDSKVVVTVKAKDLDDKQRKTIATIVMDVTNMNNVEINAKQ